MKNAYMFNPIRKYIPFLNGPIIFSIMENPSSLELKEKALQKSYKALREGGGGVLT
jgi:hypothetical protein